MNGLNFSPIDIKQQIETDFGDYTIATPLSHADWSESLGTTNFTRTLQADNAGISGKSLRLGVSAGSTQIRSLRYVPSGNPGSVEVLALLGLVTCPVSESWGGVYLRGAPGVNVAQVQFSRSSSAPNYLLSLQYGLSAPPVKVALDWSAGGYWWLRMSAVGQQCKARAWAYGTAEPSSWLIDQNMSGDPVPASGHVGLLSQRVSATTTHDVRFFSVAENGGTAPFPQG